MPVTAADVFKALSDPMRWRIVEQIAQRDELPCSVLEQTLPISRPTISYHTKILSKAGLIEAHKRGKHRFYSLRRDVVGNLVDDLRGIQSAARPRPDTLPTSLVPDRLALMSFRADDEGSDRRMFLTW